jgi:NitT/TauT family transport system substrate-binding protein
MTLQVFGVNPVIELAPVLLAVHRLYGGTQKVHHGGVAHLIDMGHLMQAQAGMTTGVVNREAPMPHGSGGADVATNAETQTLRMSVLRPDMRIILNVTEGLYRIVARRSAGIASARDLKGKRVGTFPRTSSAYYLFKELQNAGLSESDVQLQGFAPAGEVSKAMIAGEVDAISIWEPFAQEAQEALGEDAIELKTLGLYRHIFNLNTTAAKLADPAKRAEILALVKELIVVCKQITDDPTLVWPLSEQVSGHRPELIRSCWPHHRWVATLPPDLLDVMVDEEKWCAPETGRTPRTREQLATLIDDSVFKEATA